MFYIMEAKIIEMSSYARKDHFNYFKNMSYPYVGVTVNVDITDFYIKIKENKLPFFLTFLYYVSSAANAVPELRQRLHSDGIIEYQKCNTSHTVALEDRTYCYCSLDCNMPFASFLPYALKKQEEAKKNPSIDYVEDELSQLYISTVPWFSYTALVQPVPQPADSNPRITWGKFFEQEGKTLIPVSLLCHHALVDGIHIAQFYENLENRLRDCKTDLN